MKELSMMNNRDYIITDDEQIKIEQLSEQEYKGFIKLESGASIKINSIVAISEPETEAYFLGNKMSKDKTKVFTGGEWKAFCGDRSKIEYRLKNNSNNKIKKLN